MIDYIQRLWQAEVDGAVTKEERGHLPPINMWEVYSNVLVDVEYRGRLQIFLRTRTDPDPPDWCPTGRATSSASYLRRSLISIPARTIAFKILVEESFLHGL